MKLLFLFGILHTVLGKCKPICNMPGLFNTTTQIFSELEENVITEIKILETELKIAVIAETINLQKQMDASFELLLKTHEEQKLKYEKVLASIGLSPARETEIDKIVEMEKAAKSGIINSIYD